jgi:hypothetical protein
MSVATLKKAAKRGERRLTAVPRVATRAATSAKAQVRDLATQGQQLARDVAHDVDGQVKQYTGRRSAAWLDGVSRLAGNHGWIASGLGALALYALFVLLV